MTYQEILDYWMEQKPKKGIDDKLRWAEITIAIKKQIPQKPHKIKMEYANSDRVWYPTFCPRCFYSASTGLWDSLIDKGTAYCYRCGQAIDWSEEDV